MKLRMEHYFFKHRMPFLGFFSEEESNSVMYKVIDLIEAFEEREIITEFISESERIVTVNFSSKDKIIKGSIDFVSLRPFAGDSISIAIRMTVKNEKEREEYHMLKKIFGNRGNYSVAEK